MWVLVLKIPLSHAPDEIFDLHMVLAAVGLHAAAHVDAVRDDACQRIHDVHGSQASGEDGPVRSRSLDGQRPVERLAGSSKRRRVEGVQQESVDLVDTHASQRGRVFHPDRLDDGDAKTGTKLGRFGAVELHGPQATRGDELFDSAALLEMTSGGSSGAPIALRTPPLFVCAPGRPRRAPPARMSRISSGLCTSCAYRSRTGAKVSTMASASACFISLYRIAPS